MRIAIDTGGTFTDCVHVRDGELRVLKVLSTPADPGAAMLAAIATVAPGPRAEIRHGTTVGTNALLERKGARVAFITTAGFEDSLAIGRQARARLYDWFQSPPPPLAPADMCFGLAERMRPDGRVLLAPTPAAIRALVEAVAAVAPESVAVSLLFGFANPAHERALGRALARLRVPVSLSHRILPEFREYERGATVLINAYLAPRMGRYLGGLHRALSRGRSPATLHVMQSSGGVVSAAVAAREPVRTILSGPAGGVVGAWRVARQAGCDRILTFDMGGTSTDAALVTAEGLRTTHEGRIVGLPVGVPMLDIHTVGAGGGSLARFDRGGVLQVGPESAGADPGPICYGRGDQPTVCDANLMLGRMVADAFLGGAMQLEVPRTRRIFERARGPLPSVEAFADGIVRLAEARMERALRMISVERGFDPREFTLVSFGGAGPLHACALAAGLRIPRVLVPRLPGALSALGILLSDIVKDYSRTVMLPAGDPRVAAHLRALALRGAADMRRERLRARAHARLDLRYAGQGYELTVDWGRDYAAAFHRLHRLRYGYADAARPVEVVNVRVRMTASSPPLTWRRQAPRPGDGRHARRGQQPAWFQGRRHATPVYERDRLHSGDRLRGPALITEYSATTLVPPGWRLRVDEYRNLILEGR